MFLLRPAQLPFKNSIQVVYMKKRPNLNVAFIETTLTANRITYCGWINTNNASNQRNGLFN